VDTSDPQTATLKQVIEEAKAVREIARIAEKARTRLVLVVLAVATLGVLLLIGVLWIGVSNQNLSRTIADCTTAGGTCYEQSRSRTTSVIDQVIDAQIATIECRNEPDIRACVEQKLGQ
jgi:hypothetical protein